MKNIPNTFDEVMSLYGSKSGVPEEGELFAIFDWQSGYRMKAERLDEMNPEVKIVLHKRIPPNENRSNEIYAKKIASYTPDEDLNYESSEVWIKTEVFKHTLEEDKDFFAVILKN